MGAILIKWKFLIAGAAAIVILAWVGNLLDPVLLRSLEKREAEEASNTPNWRPFTNSELGYVVEFPSRPFENPNSLTNSQKVVSYHQFASTLGKDHVFMVGTLVTSVTNDYTKEQIERLLDTAAKGTVNQGGQLLSEKDINLGAFPGKEVEFTMVNGNFGRMRFYQVGHDLQEVVATVPPADRNSTNISHFMNSFRVIPRH